MTLSEDKDYSNRMTILLMSIKLSNYPSPKYIKIEFLTLTGLILLDSTIKVLKNGVTEF